MKDTKKRFLDRTEVFGYSIGVFVWNSLLAIFLASMLYLIMVFSFAEKRVLSYELSSVNGSLTLVTNIDNWEDGSTKLNGVTFEKAAKLVNKLNNNLSKEK